MKGLSVKMITMFCAPLILTNLGIIPTKSVPLGCWITEEERDYSTTFPAPNPQYDLSSDSRGTSMDMFGGGFNLWIYRQRHENSEENHAVNYVHIRQFKVKWTWNGPEPIIKANVRTLAYLNAEIWAGTSPPMSENPNTGFLGLAGGTANISGAVFGDAFTFGHSAPYSHSVASTVKDEEITTSGQVSSQVLARVQTTIHAPGQYFWGHIGLIWYPLPL